MNIYVHTALNQALADQLIKVFPLDTFTFRKDCIADEAMIAFHEAEAILGNPPINWFQIAPPQRLAMWQLDSAGFDQYKQVPVTAKVANMGDWFARPCAETIIGGVLALYRGLDQLILLQQEGKWIGTPLRQNLRILAGQRVIVLGAGTIGRAVRDILVGFGAFPILVARTAPEATIHTKEELLTVLPTADLVINTLPGAAGQYVDEVFFNTMSPTSVYANVGRGSTTDEDALIRVLQSGQIAGAVLDVTVVEPLPADSPLWNMKNVLLTQHTGGGQENEDRGKVALFIANLNHFKSQEPLDWEVDLQNGY